MENLNQHGILTQKIANLKIHILKLVEYFEQSNVYEFLQKLLPTNLSLFLCKMNITLEEIFASKGPVNIQNKIPRASNVILLETVEYIYHLINELVFIMQCSTDILV
ncbi:MAG: hypothetical protein ACW99A_16735 [Candidatus Kariarchaeaceae archaeon]|jgi:hypothetical protein